MGQGRSADIFYDAIQIVMLFPEAIASKSESLLLIQLTHVRYATNAQTGSKSCTLPWG